jgi:hypothetical protein
MTNRLAGEKARTSCSMRRTRWTGIRGERSPTEHGGRQTNPGEHRLFGCTGATSWHTKCFEDDAIAGR